MKVVKIIVLVLLGVFVVIQFKRPPKNHAKGNMPNNIATKFSIPADIQAELRTSCFDCHSNNTRYPWYAQVAPVSWWMDGHIQEAKRALNFSEFGGYRLRRQYHKFEEIAGEVSEEKMPLPSYLLAHEDAKLSPERRARLVQWANAMRDSMKAIYPPDSLDGRR